VDPVPHSGHPERLTVLVPAYNEAATIETALRRLWSVPLPLPVEVVVIDDASGDGTDRIVERLTGESPWPLRLLRHEQNRGKTAALRTGLTVASGSLTLIYDADLEYDPGDIPALLAPVLDGRADAVYGSRFQSPQRRVLFFWHALGNRLVTAFANLFANLNLTDMETCFKLVRTETLRQMRLRSERFGFEPEVTVKLGRLGQRVYEVPIRYAGRSYDEGKKIRWWDAVRAVGTILRAGLLESPVAEPAAALRYRTERLTRYHREILHRSAGAIGPRVLVTCAGTGALALNLLQSRRLVLTDPDPAAVHRLTVRFSHRPNVTVRLWDPATGPLEVGDEPFDTVLCTHVLDAVEDDQATLTNLVSQLDSAGRIVLILPAGPALLSGLDRSRGRLRRYRSEEVEELLTGAGLQAERIERFNAVGALGWWLVGRIRPRAPLGPGLVRLYGLLQPFLLLERLLPPPFGLSLLVTARRKEDYS
jgi:glycosyltransferase involved in cell wall biosynthesis